MKLWKLLIILFCAAVSYGFWSNYAGLSPGSTLPPGLIIPGATLSDPTLTGLITTAPGSTFWVQGNVIYEPYSVIQGPDGSIWNHNGLDNLANLIMSPTSTVTFADGSQWNSTGLTTTSTTTIKAPDGSVWTSTGLNNLKSLNMAGPITFNGVPLGGACPANEFMTALSPTVIPTCAAITSIPGPVTINNPTFTGTVTGPDGGLWTSTGISLPATSRISVGYVNITGTMPGLTFNGVAMGGACATGDFVNSINANGVPACGTPSGGGGSLPTPVSIGNGGLGQGVAPNAGQILVASGPAAYNPVTMTGDVTISATGVTTVTRINGVTFPTPSGPFQTLQSTATNAPIWNTAVGIGGDPVGTQAPLSITTTVGSGVYVTTNQASSVAVFNAVNTNAAGSTTLQLVAGSGGPTAQLSSTASGFVPAANASATILTGTGTGGIFLNAQTANATVKIQASTLVATFGAGNVNLASGVSLTFNGATIGGTCAAGQFMNSLSSTLIPGCATTGVTIASAAPASPALGQLWFNTVDVQTYIFYNDGTSSQWVPVINNGAGGNILNNPTFTGTMTFPDGSTYTAAGHNSMKALGIGQAVGADPIDITFNSGNALIAINNNNTGAGFVSGLQINNGTTQARLTMLASGGTSSCGSAASQPASSACLTNGGSGGITINTGVGAAPISFFNGSNATAVFASTGATFNVPVTVPLTTGTGVSSLMFGPTTSASLSAFTIGGQNAVWSMGGYSNNNAWTATSTVAIMQNMTEAAFSGLGGMAWYLNTGLTVGSTYTPTVVMQLGGNALSVGFNVNGQSLINNSNSSTGSSALATVNLSNGTNNFQMGMTGTGNGGVTWSPADGAYLWTTATGGLSLATGRAQPVKIWYNSATEVAAFTNDGVVDGLALGGYAGRVNGNNGNSALSVGNVYISGTAFATGGFSGAAYYDGTNWRGDGGGGGGSALLQLQGSCIGMYNVGATTGGTVIGWTEIGLWCGSGMSTDHLSNLTSFRLPTVSSGALTQDSRDMFGWVTNVTGGQTTITFAEPFITQSNCSLTASGAPYLWFNANQSASQDTFVCTVPWTGAQCPDGTTVEYQCFGQAGEQVKAP